LKDGNEYDVDCGGDCEEECKAKPSCFDGIQNNDEEYVDCGGSYCESCLEKGDDLDYVEVTVGSREQAKLMCADIGKVLAVITNPYENLIAKEKCSSACWIGIERELNCKTPSCWMWSDTKLGLDITLFNHWGYPGYPDYNEDKTVAFITNDGLGQWKTSNEISNDIKSALCSNKPTNFPSQPQASLSWKVEPIDGQKWSVLSTNLFRDKECLSPIIINDVGVGIDHSLSTLETVSSQMNPVPCAGEYETCYCHGFAVMGSGNVDAWNEWSPLVRVEESIECVYNNPEFGGDPAPGKAKHCYCADASNSGLYTNQNLVATFFYPNFVGCAIIETTNGGIISPKEYVILPV